MYARYKLSSVFLFLVLITIQFEAYAANYFVSTTGSDANSGTEISPFRTLAKGVTKLVPGDTLFIRGGLYAESLFNNIPGGTATAPVTVSAYPGETVTLRPNSGESVLMFAKSSSSYIVINGLLLDGINIQYDVVKITNSSTGGSSTHITIQNSEIKNGAHQGILTTGGADYNVFKNLIIHDNGRNPAPLLARQTHGIYISTSNNVVLNSTIYSNQGWGIHIYSGDTVVHCDNNIAEGNIVYDNGLSGNGGVGIGLYSGSGHVAKNNLIFGNNIGIAVDYNAVNAKVLNNTMYGNNKTDYWNGAIQIGAKASGTIVENNIVANNSSYAAVVEAGATNTAFSNNLWYQNSTGTIDNGASSTTIVNTLQGLNPQFKQPANNDFHLLSGSPAADAGKSSTDVTKDLDGLSRPQGPQLDIGCYELPSQGSAPAAPSPTPTATPTNPPIVQTPTVQPTIQPTSTPQPTIQPTATPSPTVKPTVAPVTVAAPSSLTAKIVSSTKVTLSWIDNSNNETGFQINRSTDSGLTWSVLKTLSAGSRTYSDTSVRRGRTYLYTVNAYVKRSDGTIVKSATSNKAQIAIPR